MNLKIGILNSQTNLILLFHLSPKFNSQILQKIYFPANNDTIMIPEIGTTTKPPIKINAGLK